MICKFPRREGFGCCKWTPLPYSTERFGYFRLVRIRHENPPFYQELSISSPEFWSFLQFCDLQLFHAFCQCFSLNCAFYHVWLFWLAWAKVHADVNYVYQKVRIWSFYCYLCCCWLLSCCYCSFQVPIFSLCINNLTFLNKVHTGSGIARSSSIHTFF